VANFWIAGLFGLNGLKRRKRVCCPLGSAKPTPLLPPLDPEEIRRPKDKKLGGVEVWGHRDGRKTAARNHPAQPASTSAACIISAPFLKRRNANDAHVRGLAAFALTSFVVLTLSGL
jgi:hypothetical protein